MSKDLTVGVVRMCNTCGHPFGSTDRRLTCNPCRYKRIVASSTPCACGRVKDNRARQCEDCNRGPDPALQPLTEIERGWLTGLIEGEGSFLRGASPSRNYLRVQMTDEDVVRRLQAVTGVGMVNFTPRRQSHHKDSWAWTVKRKSNLRDITSMILDGLSPRRQSQALRLHRNEGLTPDSQSSFSEEYLRGWVAGFLEGEGSFLLKKSRTPEVSAASTDWENIARLHAILGGATRTRAGKKPGWSDCHVWTVYAWPDVLNVVETVDGLLGARKASATRTLVEAPGAERARLRR